MAWHHNFLHPLRRGFSLHPEKSKEQWLSRSPLYHLFLDCLHHCTIKCSIPHLPYTKNAIIQEVGRWLLPRIISSHENQCIVECNKTWFFCSGKSFLPLDSILFYARSYIPSLLWYWSTSQENIMPCDQYLLHMAHSLPHPFPRRTVLCMVEHSVQVGLCFALF